MCSELISADLAHYEREMNKAVLSASYTYAMKLERDYELVMIEGLKKTEKIYTADNVRESMVNQDVANLNSQFKFYTFEMMKRSAAINIITGNCVPWMLSTEECIICTEKYVQKARLAHCGHVTCIKCIMSIYKINPRSVKCPMCRQPVSGYDYLNPEKSDIDYCKFK